MGKKILIVDDEENVVELLRVNLERRGFEILVAESGEQAITVALEDPPDIILLDVRLPGIDGWEVCTKLKELVSVHNVHIIILSAGVQKEDHLRADHCGASAFIAKPFDIPALIATITSFQ